MPKILLYNHKLKPKPLASLNGSPGLYSYLVAYKLHGNDLIFS